MKGQAFDFVPAAGLHGTEWLHDNEQLEERMLCCLYRMQQAGGSLSPPARMAAAGGGCLQVIFRTGIKKLQLIVKNMK
jgi:hypothetical protein